MVPTRRRFRRCAESEWTPQTLATLAIDADALPVIWDAGFLYGQRTGSGENAHVLCEINVSSVFAIPDEAPAAIARLTLSWLLARKSGTT